MTVRWLFSYDYSLPTARLENNVNMKKCEQPHIPSPAGEKQNTFWCDLSVPRIRTRLGVDFLIYARCQTSHDLVDLYQSSSWWNYRIYGIHNGHASSEKERPSNRRCQTTVIHTDFDFWLDVVQTKMDQKRRDASGCLIMTNGGQWNEISLCHITRYRDELSRALHWFLISFIILHEYHRPHRYLLVRTVVHFPLSLKYLFYQTVVI